jgi:hypothetical protein
MASTIGAREGRGRRGDSIYFARGFQPNSCGPDLLGAAWGFLSGFFLTPVRTHLGARNGTRLRVPDSSKEAERCRRWIQCDSCVWICGPFRAGPLTHRQYKPCAGNFLQGTMRTGFAIKLTIGAENPARLDCAPESR